MGADNDRDTQIMMDLMYQYACDASVYGVAPDLNPSFPSEPPSSRPVRIGFISKVRMG